MPILVAKSTSTSVVDVETQLGVVMGNLEVAQLPIKSRDILSNYFSYSLAFKAPWELTSSLAVISLA